MCLWVICQPSLRANTILSVVFIDT